jgi:rhodanese-related sulfurtransferase
MKLGALTVDALVAEIGSTTTVVSAFGGLGQGDPRLLGQATALTTTTEGDVTLGLRAARARLEDMLGSVEPRLFLATSSAAGGLRMTVHGLTARMTARAAEEAALGAGAVVKYQTVGRLRDGDLARIAQAAPSLILLAGGVEGGDCDAVLENAHRLAELSIRPIVVYGGNSVVAGEAAEFLRSAGFRVRVTSNVYPEVDRLDILPARAAIHDAFEEHITHAPGMERIGELVNGRILPTPGAVLMAVEALAARVGDLVAVDVGGATTDVHSVTDGSPEIAALQTEPQPHSRRTVEGDLGTFVSAMHVAEMCEERGRPSVLPPALPAKPSEIEAARLLARKAAVTAVRRHAGRLEYVYTPIGRKTVPRGRDLTACRLLIGTGGALTRLPGGVEILEASRGRNGGDRLLPPFEARCVLDNDYVFAACGALLSRFSEQVVVRLMLRSIEAGVAGGPDAAVGSQVVVDAEVDG